MTNILNSIDMNFITDVAKKAGEEILKIYKTDFSVSYKEHDKSPLTQADIAANELITTSLLKQYPKIPVLSEEGKSISYEIRGKWDSYWLIDPLDGTREFVNKRGDFTVNIALIQNQKPILGVVYAPDSNQLYYASENLDAWKVTKDGVKERLGDKGKGIVRDKKIVVASRSHMSAETLEFIQSQFPEASAYEIVSIGSSLKICLVADGSADMYPRLGPTMEWDTAAAHAICLEAGKKIHVMNGTQISSKELIYNKENLLNPWFVVE